MRITTRLAAAGESGFFSTPMTKHGAEHYMLGPVRSRRGGHTQGVRGPACRMYWNGSYLYDTYGTAHTKGDKTC